jgi:hypothetical protein
MGKYKTAITESAKEVIQIQEESTKNEWLEEECRQAIRQKHIARMKCLQHRTRACQEHYKVQRKGANKISKQKRNYGLKTK